jgi:hypothetical protein
MTSERINAMRLTHLLLAGALVATTAAAHAAPKRSPEAELARAVEGRTAGAPVDCITQRDIRSSRIIDGTAIVYDTGRILYVNRPTSGASSLSRDDVLVTDTHSPRLCSIDIVRLLDSGTHMPNGSVGLGPFVPYARPSSRPPR